MGSIWSECAGSAERKPQPGDITTEVAVIGGGMAGILTAYYLKRKGIHTVVLEGDRIGGGQTKNTTAKITSQHGLLYEKLRKGQGREAAAQYAHANERAIREYECLIREEGIDCGFVKCPAYLYSQVDGKKLQQEAEAAKEAGIDASFTTETELPFPVKGAVRFSGQARFHPLRFLYAVADKLTVYEKTRVKTVEGNRIVTDQGTVTAEKIVFAVHYPFLNLPGFYFMRMHQERSYVLALKEAFLPNGMYLGIDPGEEWSFRSADGLLLFGGGKHRTGENRMGGKYEQLRQKASALWPQCREVAYWSAQDCMTLDGIPYIGAYAEDTSDWYVATGFGKWGMTSSMAAAMLLSDQITGRENPNAAVFSPRRFTPAASAKNFMNDGIHAIRDLSRRLLAPPRGLAENLPFGHGGVVELDGEKVGVYKDMEGNLFAVSIQCPHLGCQLEWNPDEKSWDCPCHGSRFDYYGKLIDNPAQEDLPHG